MNKQEEILILYSLIFTHNYLSNFSKYKNVVDDISSIFQYPEISDISYYILYNDITNVNDIKNKLKLDNKWNDEKEKIFNEIENIDSIESIKDKINHYTRKKLYQKILAQEVDELENDKIPDNTIKENIQNIDFFEDNENDLLNIKDFMKLDIPERETILYPWLQEKTITLITSQRGVGKTQFVWGLVKSITQGLQFGYWYTDKEYNTLILDGELPPEELQERIPYHNLHKNCYIKSTIFDNDRKNYQGLLWNKEYRQHIENLCEIYNIKVLVLDNKKSLTPGLDENSSQEWDIINDWLLDMRGKGYSIILITHSGKDLTKGIRGHSSIEDNTDYTIQLTDKKLDSDYCRFEYRFTKVRGHISYNYLRPNILSFKPKSENNNTYDWFIENDEDNMLEFIQNNKDSMSKGQIGKELGISNSKVTRLFKKLQ